MAPIQHPKNRKSASKSSEGSSKTKKRKRSYKNQIRGVQRLLRQKDIPATVRVAQERMLNMLKDSLTETAKQQKEKKMVKKYKMVKFFEKRKITRMYKSCLNEMTQSTDPQQKNELENRLKLLKQQWNYVTYFPKDEKYISLFPPTPCTNQQVNQHQDDIFKLINDKVAGQEIVDASDLILMSPKDKKKTKSSVKGLRLSVKQVKDDDTEADAQSASPREVDDFFIDTTPSEIEPTTGASHKSEQKDENSQVTTSSKAVKTSHYKVKRLKDDRDIAAAKKNKTNKKKKEQKM